MKTIAFLVVLGGTFALLHDALGTSYALASILAWVVAIVGALLLKRLPGYRAGFRVGQRRHEAQRLRLSDPEMYDEILGTATGSDAQGAAERDPDAYVALFLSHAADAGYGGEEEAPLDGHGKEQEEVSVSTNDEDVVLTADDFAPIVKEDAVRSFVIETFVKRGLAEVEPGGQHVRFVVEGADLYLRGWKSGASRFTKEGRFERKVVEALRRENQKYGHLRESILATAGEDFPTDCEVITERPTQFAR